MEGDSGCFIRECSERVITSFPSLTKPRNGTPPECRFSLGLGIGATWFKTAYKKISGDNKLVYPRFEIQPQKQYFLSPNYSQKFIEDVSDYMVDWAIKLDLREALQSTATIPDGFGFPNNSFCYITAHAILGNIDELEKLKSLVVADLDRPIVGYVKVDHMNNAIDCCNHPEKYGLSPTLIDDLRGNYT